MRVDFPKVGNKGSVAVAFVLLLLFCLPGVIYIVWMLSSETYQCKGCGSAELVPTDSPRARQLIPNVDAAVAKIPISRPPLRETKGWSTQTKIIIAIAIGASILAALSYRMSYVRSPDPIPIPRIPTHTVRAIETVNVRAGPALGYPVLFRVEKDERVLRRTSKEVISKDGLEWIQIAREGEKVGWAVRGFFDEAPDE